MKRIFIVGWLLVVAACSTRQVRCHGPLRPINEPAVTAAESKIPAAVLPGGQAPGGKLPGRDLTGSDQPGNSAAPITPKGPQP